jgi:hypothetical protein
MYWRNWGRLSLVEGGWCAEKEAAARAAMEEVYKPDKMTR